METEKFGSYDEDYEDECDDYEEEDNDPDY